MKVIILRWGHRPRDFRLTSHVALTARALGADGIILSDVKDGKIRRTIEKVVEQWGGQFLYEDGIPWKNAVKDWKVKGGIVVHLTAYGETLESDLINKIRKPKKDILVIVGSQKVPGIFYSSTISDFNVAVGNQPHSECASLAVFLDRLFSGNELTKDFERAKLKINPAARGKIIIKLRE